MNQHTKKNYWRGLEELNSTPEHFDSGEEEYSRPPSIIKEEEKGIDRRGFLKASGFAIAGSILAACSRAPVEKAIPYLIKPEEITPGKAYYYASTCHGCSARCGILVKNRDGRPIKLEGNPQHPVSQGGLCAVGQASVLELYDSERIQRPVKNKKALPWTRVDEEIKANLDKSQSGVSLLTGTITSPSTRYWVDRFLGQFENSNHVEYDQVSCSAIPDAHEETHGVRALPQYRFNQAEIIISFGADFLGTWLSPVEFAKKYAAGRSPTTEHPEMSYHVQFESRMSLTGSNADRRFRVTPNENRAIIAAVANRLAERANRPERFGNYSTPVQEEEIEKLLNRLWDARGRSLVISDENDLAVQKAINFINHVLGNYGETLYIQYPSYQQRGDDPAFRGLIQAMLDGRVNTLIISGVNPVYSLPDSEEFVEALERVENTIVFSSHPSETTELADYLLPEPHFLEMWDDSEPQEGVMSITQPVISPLDEGRTLRQCLALWTGESSDDYELLRSYWQGFVYPMSLRDITFQQFWDYAVHDGIVNLQPENQPEGSFQFQALETIQIVSSRSGYSLVLYEKIGMRDGSHAQNPWLQELPDPVTKITWENYASISKGMADDMRIEDGDVVQIISEDRTVELPVVVQPGQHDNVIALALGYGRQGTGRFHDIGPDWIQGRPTVRKDETVGENVFPLAGIREGRTCLVTGEVDIRATGEHIELARTQTHQTVAVPEKLGGRDREMVREASLDAYRDDPTAGNPPLEEPLQLWQNDFEYNGHHWGMAIDLSKCTGCSACVIGCQAENNVPVVGKDEVRRRREMHWIRIDRYYSGDPESPEVSHQPVMCQHCDHAPCEPVCPVLATVHSEEGINQQIYNRCVGTRYCANNCPYKVRRFNWFKYHHGDERQNLVLNPDVTVRSKGVMEKCSLCVQRIAEAKNEARRQGRSLRDGEIQLACQQSCPTDAIVFGDLNDPESRISKATQNTRHYRMLQEMNFRPTVGYMTKIRNRPEQSEESHHA